MHVRHTVGSIAIPRRMVHAGYRGGGRAARRLHTLLRRSSRWSAFSLPGTNTPGSQRASSLCLVRLRDSTRSPNGANVICRCLSFRRLYGVSSSRPFENKLSTVRACFHHARHDWMFRWYFHSRSELDMFSQRAHQSSDLFHRSLVCAICFFVALNGCCFWNNFRSRFHLNLPAQGPDGLHHFVQISLRQFAPSGFSMPFGWYSM